MTDFGEDVVRAAGTATRQHGMLKSLVSSVAAKHAAAHATADAIEQIDCASPEDANRLAHDLVENGVHAVSVDSSVVTRSEDLKNAVSLLKDVGAVCEKASQQLSAERAHAAPTRDIAREISDR